MKFYLYTVTLFARRCLMAGIRDNITISKILLWRMKKHIRSCQGAGRGAAGEDDDRRNRARLGFLNARGLDAIQPLGFPAATPPI